MTQPDPSQSGPELEGDTPNTPPVDQESPDSSAPDDDDEVLDVDRARAKIRKANQEAASLRARLRELEPLADKARELERSNMTDLQRIEADRDTHRATAEAATAEVVRLRVAMRHGLSEDDLDLLGSGTEEEVEKRAKRLVERAGGTTPPPPRRRPAERLRPSSSDSGQEPEETDLSKIGASAYGRAL